MDNVKTTVRDIITEGDYVRERLLDALLKDARQEAALPQSIQAHGFRVIEPVAIAYETRERNVELYVLYGRATNSKIMAIKMVRNRTGLGLKESKDIVDNLPTIIAQRDITL